MTRRPSLAGVVQRLEDKGYRVTSPRLKVLAEIADAGDQFTAEEVAARLRGVGRATVFRTLKLLVEMDVLCRVLSNDGTLRYRWSYAGHHHHLVCAECGAVEDFTVCDVTDLLRELTQIRHFTVEGHWLEVYGRCGNCATRAGLAGAGAATG
ncbi:MAG: Fur family transcriptional regulator [Dehalococcoidia bacterium]